MAALSSHPNTWSTCLRILRQKGYRLSKHYDSFFDDEPGYHYRAEKDGYDFVADNPLELLGLTNIYEFVQPSDWKPYWWAIEGEDIENELSTIGFERVLDELRMKDPQHWETEIRKAIAEANEEASAAERLGVSEKYVKNILHDDRFRDI